jgi:hypothetical protein
MARNWFLWNFEVNTSKSHRSKMVNLIFQWVSHKFPMGFPIQSAVLFCNQDAMAARVRSTAPWATSRCLRSAVKETLGFNGFKLKQRKLGFNYLEVSWNRATPRSSFFLGFSILNHPFGGTPIYGNPYFNVGKIGNLVTVESQSWDTWPAKHQDWPSQNMGKLATNNGIQNEDGMLEHSSDQPICQ